MIIYKIDVLAELREAGYSSARIRKEKLIPEGSLQNIRENKMIAIKTLDTLCRLLDMQPGNIIKYVDDPKK